MLVQLVGGGWDPAAGVYRSFLDAAGRRPVVACVVLDEGDGVAQFARWRDALRATAACDPVPLLVPAGGTLPPGELAGADALCVCGGLTPAYAAALSPVAAAVRAWLAAGERPYVGYSAGAALAATDAVVGGWRDGGAAVCPPEAAEDLEEVTVVGGLGLVPGSVDVHCAQWGTLPRLVAALRRTGRAGVGLDEDTALEVRGERARVVGLGHAYRLLPGGDGLRVTVHAAGEELRLAADGGTAAAAAP